MAHLTALRNIFLL